MRGLACLIFAATLVAQPVRQPPSNNIPKLLKSKEPWERAWGAKLAGDSGNRKWIPDMIRLLERKRRTEDDRKVPLYALETLIQFDAEVPEKVLERLAHDYFDGVVILLRRDVPMHVGLLMRLLDETRDDREKWVLTRALFAQPTPGFMARSFREWTVEARLEVYDPPRESAPGIEEMRLVTSNFAAEFGCAGPGHGIQNSTGKFPWWPLTHAGDACRAKFDPDQERNKYFWAMAPDLQPSRAVVYRNTDTIRQEAGMLRAAAERYVDQLRTRLIERKLLKATDQARPRVVYRVADKRQDKSVPLPEIPGLLP